MESKRRSCFSVAETVLILGVGCALIFAAPPGQIASGPAGLNSALIKNGHRVLVDHVPAAPPVYALTDSAIALREAGGLFANVVLDAWDIASATGGPTSCELNRQCDDCNPCTIDTCVITLGVGACEYTLSQVCNPCDDGLFCNGTDRCDGAGNCLFSPTTKQFACIGGVNDGAICFEPGDPLGICDDPADCQFLTNNSDPCRFYFELICDEEELVGESRQVSACVLACQSDADCDDGRACNGGEVCLKRADLGPGHGGECVGGTTPGDPCLVDEDCGGDAFCGGVCRPAPERPCGSGWGQSIVTCKDGTPLTCGPGRCCTPNGNDWNCQRANLQDCAAAGGHFLGVGDLAATVFDDADKGGCLDRADETFPFPGESFLCPKYSAGITDGDLVGTLGPAGAAACRPYWEIGDDYRLSNCKEGFESWYRVYTVRWIGELGAGRGARVRVTFYDSEGRFISDRVTTPILPSGIVRHTVIFDEEPVIPCQGFVTIKPAVQFTPDTLIEWAVTDSVSVGTTDSFLYVRRHGFCSAAPALGCNADIDCGTNGPCTITSDASSTQKIAPLEPIPLPEGGAGLAVEIVGVKVPEPSGACCNPASGDCTLELPWICEGRGDFFQGSGTSCNNCSNDVFRACDQAVDCFVCDDGGRGGELCVCPGGICDVGVCTGGARDGEDCDCPDGICNGEPATCLRVPPQCQLSACCSKTDGACIEVTGYHCVGGGNDGNSCNRASDCLPGGSCFFASGRCSGGTRNGLDCAGDAECDGFECVAPCPEGFNSSGFGTNCDPNCCTAAQSTGGDTCAEAPIAIINVPALGQPPVTLTVTGNNKGATFGDNDDQGGGTCSQEMFSTEGGTRDRGWWQAFQTDRCADVRIDMCCTEEISGEIHQPQQAMLFADCDPCTKIVRPKATGAGSFPAFPIGDTRSSGRGAPFCVGQDIWFTFRNLPHGPYYLPIYSGVGGHFGDYQLHITVSACAEAACCLPESVCVGGPLDTLGCNGNDDCAPNPGDEVCVNDSNRPNALCCPGGACDLDPKNPTCFGGSRDGLVCCDGGGECKGNCLADCAVIDKPTCEAIDGYWMGFGNIPLGDNPTLTCDTGVCERGSCCLGGGSCADDRIINCTEGTDCCGDGGGDQFCIDRKQCEIDGGQFVGGGRCEYPKAPCPACDFKGDDNCHHVDNFFNFALMSDLSILPNGVLQADDIILASPEVSEICVWGLYMDAVSPNDPDSFDCSGNVQDKFRVRFYADDGGGKPDHRQVLGEALNLTIANGGVVKSDTQVPTSAGMRADLHTLRFPTMNLPSGVRIWLEVANNTDTLVGLDAPLRNSCYWHWVASYPGFGGDGNSWSVAGSDLRDDRPSGYLDLSGRWEDLVFCLNGPNGPVNFIDPPTPTGSCCTCKGFCDDGLTLEECSDGDPGMDRLWRRNGTCPAGCQVAGVPGDDCGGFAGVAATGLDCGPGPPPPTGCLHLRDGLFQADTVCATSVHFDELFGVLGRDIFACHTTTCTGELVANMCGTNIYYGNMDSFLAVYHDFANPQDCPCPSSAEEYLVALSDEGCNAMGGGGAGIFQGQLVFPGECWLMRMGGWGRDVGSIDGGRIALDIGCVADVCPLSSPPELQKQFNPDGGARDGPPESKNRYLAVTAGDVGHQQTIRVTWGDMPNWPGGHSALIGQEKWILEPFQVCEGAGQIFGPPCGIAPGQPQRWFWAARLTCDPLQAWFGDLAALSNHCARTGELCDPSEPNTCSLGPCGVDGVIHIIDRGIAPSKKNPPQPAMYIVQTIADLCLLNDEGGYSEPLIVNNPIWGDVLLGNGSCPTGPPNNNPDISDVLGVLNKFSNAPCAPKKTRADMEPATPNLKVGIIDVLHALGGFAGTPYPFDAGAACAIGIAKSRVPHAVHTSGRSISPAGR